MIPHPKTVSKIINEIESTKIEAIQILVLRKSGREKMFEFTSVKNAANFLSDFEKQEAQNAD